MPPPEYFNGKIWRLNKTIYGLCDGARAWYLRVKDELLALGAQVSKYDSALFTWTLNGSVEGHVCVYVDDFLWSGSVEFEGKVIDKIKNLFLLGSSETGSFKYVGLRMATVNDGVTVDQLEYISTLKPIILSAERASKKSSELSSKEQTEYRALVGQLNWVGTQTRPDVLFDVCDLSVSLKTATVGDILRLNKVVSRLNTDHVKLHFPKIESIEECRLVCYSDASFANLSDGGSQVAFVIFLEDKTGAKCPIYWQSKKARRVIKSTLAAETLALLDCAEAAVYIAHIISDMLNIEFNNVICYVDNKSLVDSLHSSKLVEDKRLRIDLAVLQNMMECGEISKVLWVDTKQQLANCLTKRGASTVSLLETIGH